MFSQNNLSLLFIQGCGWSLVSLLLLILAGGIVRSSGSGMGCPDWPKCFNRIVPPTSEKELPADYKQAFISKRILKNQKLVKVLRMFGWKNIANRVEKDPSLYQVESFNAFNTWTEYINRLIGMITGLLFLFVFLVSWFIYKSSPSLFWISGINLLLIFFQAYLGSLVVSTHLLSGLITIHMVLALFILILLIMDYWKGKELAESKSYNLFSFKTSTFKWALVGNLVLNFIQILWGTQVRENLDQFGVQKINGDNFSLAAGNIFEAHRLLALLIAGLSFFISLQLIRAKTSSSELKNLGKANLFIISFQIILGLSLQIGPMPPVSQALHVFFAVLMFSSLLWTYFLYEKESLELNKLVYV